MSTITQDEIDRLRERYEHPDADDTHNFWRSGVLFKLLDAAERCAELETWSSYCTGMDLQCAELKESNERNKELESGIRRIVSGLLSDYDYGFIRCEITDNPSDTDTWMVGKSCSCNGCKAYLYLSKLIEGKGYGE